MGGRGTPVSPAGSAACPGRRFGSGGGGIWPRGRRAFRTAAGALPAGTSAEALAGLTLAVVQGMSVLARDDAPRGKLLALVDQAMRAWPTAALTVPHS